MALCVSLCPGCWVPKMVRDPLGFRGVGWWTNSPNMAGHCILRNRLFTQVSICWGFQGNFEGASGEEDWEGVCGMCGVLKFLSMDS